MIYLGRREERGGVKKKAALDQTQSNVATDVGGHRPVHIGHGPQSHEQNNRQANGAEVALAVGAETPMCSRRDRGAPKERNDPRSA